jgi:dTDP-4-amino-4,6-dideoxygalactose transaminase
MIPHSKPLIGEEEIAAVTGVLRSGMLAQGPEVRAFEEACAELVGRRYAVAVNSGTAALHLALNVLGIGRNRAVALPSYACASLVQTVFWQLAEPILCDVDDTWNLDPDQIPGSCDAVIVPHLFGATASVPAGHTVIEDIAQSLGGKTGSNSPVAIASFYATKLVTTGEGGMLLTDDPGLAAAAHDLRDYDNRDDFDVRYAYKMTDFQAALGRVQLTRLPEFIRRRREIAASYNDAFADLPMQVPAHDDHVYFRYVVALSDRDRLQAHLLDAGIEAKRPVHRPAHHFLGGDFPQADRAHRECLSLPIYPAMRGEDVRAVIDSVLRFFGG